MERLAATPIERDVILVEGSDAISYLHSQLTQDVEGLEVGASAWSFLLEPKSEIIALLRVTRTGEESLALDTELGCGDSIRQRIDGFLFRMDVTFTSERWNGVSWRGPGADDLKADTPIAMRSPWPGGEGLDLLGPDVVTPGDVDVRAPIEFDGLRIRYGWPSMAELGAKTTPVMTGIVSHTVSFTKGCYTGQEFVARVHYRGATPPRQLVQIGFHPCSKPVAGDSLLKDGESIGELTSVSMTQPLALAYVSREADVPGEATLGTAPVCIGALPVSSAVPEARAPRRTSSPLTLS